MEDYDLPILQDTEGADVSGLYGAEVYDTFVVDRSGLIAAYLDDYHPLAEPEPLLEVLAAIE